jgi:hypothetical protein
VEPPTTPEIQKTATTVPGLLPEAAQPGVDIYKFKSTNTRRYQYLPARNEQGDKPPSPGIMDFTKWVTVDSDTQCIIEDADIHDLASTGLTARLPPESRNICTQFYFGSTEDRTGTQSAFYISRRGGTLTQVAKQIGIRDKQTKTHGRYLSKASLVQFQVANKEMYHFNKHKRPFETGTGFPQPRDARWFDLVRVHRKRQEFLEKTSGSGVEFGK